MLEVGLSGFKGGARGLRLNYKVVTQGRGPGVQVEVGMALVQPQSLNTKTGVGPQAQKPQKPTKAPKACGHEASPMPSLGNLCRNGWEDIGFSICGLVF